jgi:nucleoside-diphosphate-sugar epimerase
MKNSDLHVVLGTGALGITIAQKLHAQGKSVRIVNRKGKSDACVGIESIAAQLMIAEEVSKCCQGASVVYHCACPSYTQWPEQFPSLMKSIIAGVAITDAKLIFGDNLYMYGVVHGEIHENLPYSAKGRKGRVRAAIANQLLKAHEQGQVKVAIGRASNFYGQNVTNSVVGEGVFAKAIVGEPAQLLGDPDLPHTYTYIDDFAQGLITLGEQDKALGEVWHIPSAETLTTRQFLELVYKEAGYPMTFQVAPKLGIKFLSLFNPMMREVKEMLYEFEHPFVMSHQKFEQAFGASSTPHSIAIPKTVEWHRKCHEKHNSK